MDSSTPTNDGESRPLLSNVKPYSDKIERNKSEPASRMQHASAMVKQRSRSLSFATYGSHELNDLMNFDPETLVPVNRRASIGGCVADIGELTSLLSSQEEDSSLVSDEERATYWKLVRYNIPYTLYILSYFSAHAGEWFTYVAQLTAVEKISSGSQTAISVLVAIRMVPNIFFASFGGALADATDRRVSMIALDVTGMFVVLLYLPVLHYESLSLLYTIAFVQATVAAIYDPVRQSIVPLLVPQEDYLKKATTIAGIAWSLMAAVGASIGGIVASALGIRMSFQIDSLTYFISAFLMWLVPGTWSVAQEKTSQEKRDSLSVAKAIKTYKSMTVEGIQYLANSSFALFVFIKSSGALTFGSVDVLNVRLSHIEGDENGDSRRLGILFGTMGVGCLVGPLVAEKFIDMKRPRTLLGACVIGFAFIALGFASLGISSTFLSVCISTFIRGIGSSIMWTNSTLMLQKFSAREKLGRVLSVDFGLCTLVLAISAFVAGLLEDHAHMTPEQISVLMAIVGGFVFALWGFYFIRGAGPAGKSSSALDYDVLLT